MMKPVMVIGATNRPDALDSALRRAGRFDREILMGVPDEAARLSILRVLTSRLRLAGDFNLEELARRTPGYVGMQCENSVVCMVYVVCNLETLYVHVHVHVRVHVHVHVHVQGSNVLVCNVKTLYNLLVWHVKTLYNGLVWGVKTLYNVLVWNVKSLYNVLVWHVKTLYVETLYACARVVFRLYVCVVQALVPAPAPCL